MPDPRYLLAAVAVSAAVTWGLRALPFTALAPLRASRTVRYLSTRMPAGVMVILLGYCLRSLPLTSLTGLVTPLLALAVTVGLQVWRRNALLSILGGTAVNVALASALLSHWPACAHTLGAARKGPAWRGSRGFPGSDWIGP